MALSAKQGSFTAPTSAATNTVVSGLGFGSAPKAVMLWATLATADGFVAGAGFSIGFASGSATTAQCACGINGDDNVGTTNVSREMYDGLLVIPNASASAALWAARLLSFDSDGFTIDWITVQATGIIVHWLAFGGADLTNAEVARFAAATGTGNQVVNTGFQGDVILFIGIQHTAVGRTGTAVLDMGAAESATKRWCSSIITIDATNMTAAINAGKSQRTDSCLLAQTTTNTQDGLADFVSFNATPSFTINWSDAPGGAHLLGYLLLKGGNYEVGSFSKTTSAAPVNQDVTAPGFQPSAVLLSSFGNATTTSFVADLEQSIGGFDGTNEGSAWTQHKDAVLNTEANASIISTKAIRLAESPTTVDSEADGSMLSNGFRLAWTTNLTSKADEICYVLFGNTPAGGTQYTIDIDGTVTPVGAIVKQVGLHVVGSETPVGILVKRVGKTETGTVTPTGVLVDRVGKVFAGTATPTGGLVKSAGKVFDGTVTQAGSLLKQVGSHVTGTVIPVGSIVKQVGLHLAGSETSAGALEVLKVAIVSATGTVTPIGTLGKQAGLHLAGVVAPIGSLARQTGLHLIGTLTPVGALAKRAGKNFAGAVTPAGALAVLKVAIVNAAGTVTPAGSLTKRAGHMLSGAVSSIVGALVNVLIPGGAPAATDPFTDEATAYSLYASEGTAWSIYSGEATAQGAA